LSHDVSKGKGVARFLFGSPILTIGRSCLFVGVLILIAHGATDSSRMSRDAEEFLVIIEVITLLVGIILVVAGLLSRWMKSRQ